MLEIMISKLSEQPAYMAWYLRQYAEDEKMIFSNFKDNLQITAEQFGRLAMCKAPSSYETDFISRLKKIGDYTGVSYFRLVSIIRKVDALATLKSTSKNEGLLAARKQEDSQDEPKSDDL